MKAVVYGGGNIGRGFLGQLLYESGFETVFVDVFQPMIDRINETGGYTIRVVSNEEQKDIKISNCRAVHLHGKTVHKKRGCGNPGNQPCDP